MAWIRDFSCGNPHNRQTKPPSPPLFPPQPPFSPLRSGPKVASRPSRQKQIPSSNNPLSPPSAPVQRWLQGPPAKSKFLAATVEGSTFNRWAIYDGVGLYNGDSTTPIQPCSSFGCDFYRRSHTYATRVSEHVTAINAVIQPANKKYAGHEWHGLKGHFRENSLIK